MKFTLSWLKSHLETTASLENIVDALTSLGLVVESVEDPGKALLPFKIVRVVEALPHPDADRLKICHIETDQGPLQVVCGGVNARTGMKAVLARPGDVIPSTGIALKTGNIRGVESQGMLCSAEELGLNESCEGIIDVSEEAPLGMPYVEWIGQNDPLIEIEVTPNRGDALGVYGVARDLAAKGLGWLKPLPRPVLKTTETSSVIVSLEAPKACPYFVLATVKDVDNKRFSSEISHRLKSVGMASVSPLVDITNFLNIDQARPLHVFDADKVKGTLRVCLSQGGEFFQALDGKTYTLRKGMIIICDDTGPISLAGIMGGISTAVDVDTRNVLVESALFDPIRIAETGRALGIHSDSRYRFERGIDPESVLSGLERAVDLILQTVGGSAATPFIAGRCPSEPASILFDPGEIERLTGLSPSRERIQQILEALGCRIEGRDGFLKVFPPSWRVDLTIPADIVEEVLRIKGYDKLPSVFFSCEEYTKPLSLKQERPWSLRSLYATLGYTEVITWSFISEKEARLFGEVDPLLILENPISEGMRVMRSSLLPSLLKTAADNLHRGETVGAIFEVGPCFQTQVSESQERVLGALRWGKRAQDWLSDATRYDVFDVKADLLSGLESLGVKTTSLQLSRGTSSVYHPWKSGVFKQGKTVLGAFGELHPQIAQAFGIKEPVLAFEIFLDVVPVPKSLAKSFYVPSVYPEVSRDFAFVISKEIMADQVIQLARKIDPELVREVTVFDYFCDEKMGDDQISLGIRLTLQADDRTLTEEDISLVSQKLIDSIMKKVRGKLRQ